jgi:hypothetical protein
MPAPSVRATSSVTGATASTFSVSKPTGTQQNDVLLAFEASSGVSGPAAPSGWTKLDGVSFNSSSRFLDCFWKLAGSSEPASYTFNNAGSVSPLADVWLYAISGAASTGPEGDATNSGIGASLSTGSYTTQQANELICCAFATAGSGPITPDGSLTDLGSLNGGNNTALDSGYRVQASAGSTSDTASMSSGTWGAMIVAIGPPAAAGLPRSIIVRPSIHPSYLE